DTKLQANNPPPTLLFLLNLQFSKSTPIRSAVGHPDKSGHTLRRVAAKRLSIDDDDGGAKPNRSEQFAPNQFSADRPARPGATAVVDERDIGHPIRTCQRPQSQKLRKVRSDRPRASASPD
ncbi:hypothetical protein N7I30_09780, partial [Aurantimonas litoralis]|nr:hypothetical protein [Aurantimonas litoralis]